MYENIAFIEQFVEPQQAKQIRFGPNLCVNIVATWREVTMHACKMTDDLFKSIPADYDDTNGEFVLSDTVSNRAGRGAVFYPISRCGEVKSYCEFEGYNIDIHGALPLNKVAQSDETQGDGITVTITRPTIFGRN